MTMNLMTRPARLLARARARTGTQVRAQSAIQRDKAPLCFPFCFVFLFPTKFSLLSTHKSMDGGRMSTSPKNQARMVQTPANEQRSVDCPRPTTPATSLPLAALASTPSQNSSHCAACTRFGAAVACGACAESIESIRLDRIAFCR